MVITELSPRTTQLRGFEERLKVKGRDSWESHYSSVRKFLDHYKRKQKASKTRYNALIALDQLCVYAKKTPDELVKLSRGQATKVVQSFVDKLHDDSKSIRYLNVLLDYYKTFFVANGFKNGKELDLERYMQPARYRKTKEYIPTPDEIRSMAFASKSMRNRALILTLYMSGLRLHTLIALLYKDVRNELESSGKIVKMPVYPEMKEKHSDACKGMIPYYTFIVDPALQAIRDYLRNERPDIKPTEPLFCATSTNIAYDIRRNMIVDGRGIEKMVKIAAKNAGVEEWKHVTPHCLRKAFEFAMRSSKLDPDDREFLMGHILPGTKDAYYAKDKIEYLRAEYAKAKFFGDGESVVKDAFKRLAQEMGLEVKENAPMEDTIVEIAKVYKAAKEDLAKRSNNGKQKMIKEDELDKYLEEGWELVNVLPSGKLVVKWVS